MSAAGSGSRSSQSGVNLLDRQQIGQLCQKVLIESTDSITAAEEVHMKLSQRSKFEIDTMREELEQVQVQEAIVAEAIKEKAELLDEIGAVKDRKHAELAEQLNGVKVAELKAEEEKEDMQDEVKGLEAAHELKLRLMEEQLQQVNEVKDKKARIKSELVSEVYEEQTEMVAALKKEAKEKKLSLELTKAERDALRRDKQRMKQIQAKEVEHLKQLIETAKNTLDGEVHVPEAIVKVQEQSEALQETLIDLKREVQRAEQESATEVRSLELKIETVKSQKEEVKSSRRGKTRRGKYVHSNSGKMPSIDEEDDDDNMSVRSYGHSGVVSDGDGVGDLGDFDDADEDEDVKSEKERRRQERITELRDELREKKRVHTLFRDEVAGKKAKMKSQKERLTAQLKVMQEGQRTAAGGAGQLDVQLQSLREENEKREALLAAHDDKAQGYSGRIEALQLELQELERAKRASEAKASLRKERHLQDVEDVNNKFYHAREIERISQMRMEDTKSEIDRNHAATIAGYERVLSTLRERMRRFELDLSGSRNLPDMQRTETEVENERQIQLLREERNDILHQLERKEAMFQSSHDDLESRLSEETADVKKEHKQRLQFLQTTHAEEKQELLEKKDTINQEMKINRVLRSDTKQLPAAEANPPPPELPELPAWLKWLQCPQRDSVPSGPAIPNNCQMMCWQMLNAFPEVNAMLCNQKDLEIRLASKKAYKVWGSAALHGHSLLSLLHRPEEAAWLKRAIGSHQVLADLEKTVAPGFLIRDLGCLALRTRANSPFDAVVITAHLPAETKSGRSKVILVIMQPMVEESRPALNLGQGNGQGKTPRQRSGSEVSGDINPSDSVSRVGERRYGY